MKDIKLYIIASLLLVIFAQVLHKAGYIAYFKYNRTAIATKHCINQDRPELECDGKCHLKNYLSHSEEAAPQENNEEKCPASLEFLKNGNPFYIAPNLLASCCDSRKNFNPLDLFAEVQRFFMYKNELGYDYQQFMLRPPIYI